MNRSVRSQENVGVHVVCPAEVNVIVGMNSMIEILSHDGIVYLVETVPPMPVMDIERLADFNYLVQLVPPVFFEAQCHRFTYHRN